MGTQSLNVLQWLHKGTRILSPAMFTCSICELSELIQCWCVLVMFITNVAPDSIMLQSDSSLQETTIMLRKPPWVHIIVNLSFSWGIMDHSSRHIFQHTFDGLLQNGSPSYSYAYTCYWLHLTLSTYWDMNNLRTQLIINWHWFRQCLGAKHATNHYLNQY